MNNQFSKNLKQIRKNHNLSQEQLADEIGVSRQAISKWESAVAYPEMDKIIALCDKFNINIDDLLHKNIKEVKGEEESKKKINNFFSDFLNFITDTINLFSNMNFKSKIKCLFEQAIIIVILLIISIIVVKGLGSLFSGILSFLPDRVNYFLQAFLVSILIIFLILSSIIILVHVFKTRYLDYYVKLKKEMAETKEDSKEKENITFNEKKEITTDHKNKILFKKNEKKIIIRDPKNSEYKFINGLFKFIINIIKFFLLCFALFVAFILICLFSLFIISFLTYKTGVFFIGMILTILSASVISIVTLLLILNFVFNRNSDKKKIIWSFISSFILFGIGCGLVFIGALNFDVLENNETMLKVEKKEHDMRDNLVLFPYNELEYVESDINNIKIEYSANKYCEINERMDNNEEIMMWVICDLPNPTKIAREFIKNINDKKIIPINNDIEKITIYASKYNIEKIKNNNIKYLEKRELYSETISSYEQRIIELETENGQLNDKIYNLQEQVDNYQNIN